MTDDEKKRLTKLIGTGPWHEIKILVDRVKCSCGEIFHPKEVHEAGLHCKRQNRAFDNWVDLGATMEALVKTGKWNDFDEWTFEKWDSLKPFKDRTRHIGQFTAWLMRPVDEHGNPHFCELGAEFLERERDEHREL
jgi:hypothetical protein